MHTQWRTARYKKKRICVWVWVYVCVSSQGKKSLVVLGIEPRVSVHAKKVLCQPATRLALSATQPHT